MEKIKVWNWQRVHNENASVQGWVYRMAIDKRVRVSSDGTITLTDGSGAKAAVGDYLVWFRDTDELRAVGKDDFESNYERMT